MRPGRFHNWPQRLTATALAVVAAVSCAPGRTAPPAVAPGTPAPAVAPNKAVAPGIEEAAPVDASPASPLASADASAALASAVVPASAELPPEENGPFVETVDEFVERLSLDEKELSVRVAQDLGSLGSMSVGKPNGGALINGVHMPESEHWQLIIPQLAWGTEETIHYLTTAIGAVVEQFPDSHPMFIGHLSRQEGGPLRPHRSHQSGRDVDLGYYYVPERAEWYRPATKHTLDRARTWAFVKALITLTDVEYIFMSTRVQMLVKEYALSIGEDADWLNSIFEFRSRNPEPIIRHTWGHRTHMHVRFYNPKAQAMGIRSYDALARHRVISPQVRFQPYLAKPGDSYAQLAQLAGVQAKTVEDTNAGRPLLAGRVVVVPVRGDVVRVDRLDVPVRRLPPGPSTTHATVVASPLDN